MLREFKEIYNTRSQIVHRGKTAFTNREDQQLAALRWFCAGLINNELRLLQGEREER